MVIVEFDNMPGWAVLSWTDAWAWSRNALDFCTERFGDANVRWGVYFTDKELDTYSPIARNSALPKRLWFSEPEDALVFRLGFACYV